MIRGIGRPENTNKAFVTKAAGAGTAASRSEMQIRNRISANGNNPINNPTCNPISTSSLISIAKLNGTYTKKLRNAIKNSRWNPENGCEAPQVAP